MTSGGCEILHADCIEVLQTLAENSFDALITDPPYSSGGQYRGDRMQSVTEKYSQSGAKAEYLKHAFEGDNMDQRAWTSWTAYWLELCRKVVKPGGVAAIFIDWRQLPALYDAIQWGGWVVRGLIPWDKKNARPQPHRPKQQCEFIVWASNGPLDVKRDAEYMPGLLQGAAAFGAGPDASDGKTARRHAPAGPHLRERRQDHRPVRRKRHHDMRSVSGRLRRAGYRAEQVSRRKGTGKINENRGGGVLIYGLAFRSVQGCHQWAA